MRAVLIQAAPVEGDPEANVAAACAAIEAAAGADLVAFPEMFLGGFRIRRLRAVPPDAFTRIGAAAREAGATVVIGGPEAVGDAASSSADEGSSAAVDGGSSSAADGALANSAFVFGPDGALAGVYRKTHLFGAEREALIAGDELAPIYVAGRRLGVMLCFDVEFPEVARTLALRGAELLVTLSANMEPFEDDHDAFVRSRALENERPHLYVNRTGTEAGAVFVGRSQAVDAEGRVLAMAGSEPETLMVELPPPGRADERTQYLAQRRPELYNR
jgi:predicted amidohydrolase